MSSEQMTLQDFEKRVLDQTATWWEMKLPSGSVIFGTAKTDMIGYPESDFKQYQDFTSLLHKDDYEVAMQAMRDHLEGKKDFYETTYRIKHKDGHYIRFYDCGRVVKKEGDDITLMGFVMKINEDVDIAQQMKDFKNLILERKPAMIDLVNTIIK